MIIINEKIEVYHPLLMLKAMGGGRLPAGRGLNRPLHFWRKEFAKFSFTKLKNAIGMTSLQLLKYYFINY